MVIKHPCHKNFIFCLLPLSSSFCFSYLLILTFRGFLPPIHAFFFTLLSLPNFTFTFLPFFFPIHPFIYQCPPFSLRYLILLSYISSFFPFIFLPSLFSFLLSFLPSFLYFRPNLLPLALFLRLPFLSCPLFLPPPSVSLPKTYIKSVEKEMRIGVDICLRLDMFRCRETGVPGYSKHTHNTT